MHKLFKNIRFYILLFSTLHLSILYFLIKKTYPSPELQSIRLAQFFALTATVYLYLALLASPLIFTFKNLPFAGKYIQARRALGFSAFIFICAHVYFAFFGELGGFARLPFLPLNYLIAISLGFTAFIIIGLMAATSFDAVIRRLTFTRWKALHRFVYLASFLILIHALMLGAHFADISQLIPKIYSVALSILLILEARRLHAYLLHLRSK